MRQRILMLFTLLLIGVSTAIGQTITAKGRVVDETGAGVPSATIRAKSDAQKGAFTDMDGNFTITVKQGEKLVISYVGYNTLEVAAAPNMGTIQLQPNAEVLDEVMVVAYGTAKKSTFTGSATVVDSKSIGKMQANDAVKALQGVVPGLQISSLSGAPGSSSTIRLRGIGSINGSSAPLIVLNGAPYDGSINSINAKDIENISFLKDAASASLYGARGANGVIIITTKNGKAGITNVEFDARVGVNQRGVPEYDRVTDPGRYYELYWEAIRNSHLYADKNPLSLDESNALASQQLITDYLGYNIFNVPNNELVTKGKLNPKARIIYEDAATFNDWASELMSPKMRQEYNLSLTRGSDKSSTYFSVGYLDDKGYAINTAFSRLTSRLSYSTELTKWLKLQASSQLAYTYGNFGASESSTAAFSNIFFFTRSVPVIYPVYAHDGNGKFVLDPDTDKPTYDIGKEVKGVHGNRGFSSGKNIVGENLLNRDTYNRLYLTQNGRVDVDLTHGFKLNSTLTYNFINTNSAQLTNPIMGDGKEYGGYLYRAATSTHVLNWNQVLTYDVKLNDLSLQAMLGHESYMWRYHIMEGEKQNTLIPTSVEFNTFALSKVLDSSGHNYNVEGYFGQITADYLDKYYISASLRRDGSSIFAPDKRWGSFWSLGASWRLSQEDFLKGAEWLDNLKLRASVGKQGNDYLQYVSGGYYYRNYTPYTDTYQIKTDGTKNSLSPYLKGNPDITWEKNLNVTAGLETSMFSGRLRGEFDFFYRNTTDMLFNEPMSKTTGFSSVPKNIGSMYNIGFEFNVSGDIVRTNDVQFSVGFNGMTYKNTITKLPERFREEGLSDGVRILKIGGGIYDIYQVKYVGVNPEDGTTLFEKFNDKYDDQYKEFEEARKAFAEKNPGKPYPKELGDDMKPTRFDKVSGNDYRAELRDRQYVGSAIPKLEGGFFTNLSLYGVDLGLQFAYRWGGKIYDNGYSGLMHTGGSKGDVTNWHADIENRWTPENKNTRIPRLQVANQKLIRGSDMFIIDASYLSLSNVTLGYTLPTKWVSSIGLRNVRLYATADNVFVLSARKGLDPRTSLSGASAGNRTSAIRAISGGVSISF